MKKIIMLLFILIPVCVIGQVQDSTQYPQPGSVFDIFSDLNYWLSSTATVAGLTIFLTLLVSKFWKTITSIWKQVVAVLISVVLMFVGNLANIGFMAEFTILSTVIYGIVTGLMANGLYDLKNITK
jgi:Na+/melibiose symporter-like transporter